MAIEAMFDGVKSATATMALRLVLGLPSYAADRSREVTREFQHLHPCPATGKRYGACPGYVKDHIDPLCNGGPDAVANMQWQSVADALGAESVPGKTRQ